MVLVEVWWRNDCTIGALAKKTDSNFDLGKYDNEVASSTF